MIVDVLIFCGGLVALLAGGEGLVRGATALSHRFGVSSLVIGMTVLAFGTSAPELAVNVAAALKGRGAITFGNVVGSNIANIGLILGLAAAIRSLEVHTSIVAREMPVMLWATLGMIVLGGWGILSGDPFYGRFAATALLAGFVAFLLFTVRSTRRTTEDSAEAEVLKKAERRAPERWIPATLLTVGGLGGILIGSQWTVDGATNMATRLGVSEAVIGLTIVAVGTSLPELTATLFAAFKGHADMAIGNVVGSNIFNLLFVLAVSAMVRPVPVPAGGAMDLAALGVFSVILLPFARSQKRLARVEGLLLVAGYIAYMIARSAR